jgi:hypothetical protein
LEGGCEDGEVRRWRGTAKDMRRIYNGEVERNWRDREKLERRRRGIGEEMRRSWRGDGEELERRRRGIGEEMERRWREVGEMERRWRGIGELERKWGEGEEPINPVIRGNWCILGEIGDDEAGECSEAVNVEMRWIAWYRDMIGCRMKVEGTAEGRRRNR